MATYAVVSFVFLPLGIFFLYTSQSLNQIEYRYDNQPGCNVSTDCRISIPISQTLQAPVFVYYQLTNYFQNHRSYVKSIDFSQLVSDSLGSTPATDCAPLLRFGDGKNAIEERSESEYLAFLTANPGINDKYLYPCGLIAQSIFNDQFTDACVYRGYNTTHFNLSDTSNQTTFTSTTLFVEPLNGNENPGDSSSSSYSFAFSVYSQSCRQLIGANFDSNGIAWSSDRAGKFMNRNVTAQETAWNPRGFIQPTVDDEDFIVWMRTATTSSFTKLTRIMRWRGLNVGELLEMDVANRFDVSDFQGTKSIILAEAGWLGGRNPFLGIAFICVGTLHAVLSMVFWLRFRQPTGYGIRAISGSGPR